VKSVGGVDGVNLSVGGETRCNTSSLRKKRGTILKGLIRPRGGDLLDEIVRRVRIRAKGGRRKGLFPEGEKKKQRFTIEGHRVSEYSQLLTCLLGGAGADVLRDETFEEGRLKETSWGGKAEGDSICFMAGISETAFLSRTAASGC